MGIYNNCLLPLSINWLLGRKIFLRQRKLVTKELKGIVLEVGFGTGLNLPYYPDGVKKVYAVDPCEFGRRLAAKRINNCCVPVEFVGLDGEDIPLRSKSVDVVLSTWTLCTIPGVSNALRELWRVLKSNGRLYFIEHGVSPDADVAKWQHRLNPLQKVVAGGCQLNREIDKLINGAGFHIDVMNNFYMNGPSFCSYMYKGVARK